MNKYLLLLSGGVGKRFGENIPKQYYRNSKGEMILIKSIEGFSDRDFNGIVIVADEEYHSLIKKEISDNNLNLGKLFFTDNGNERHTSIINGLDKLKEIGANDQDLIFIQESVRPYIKERIIDQLISFDSLAPNVCPGIAPIVMYAHYDGNIAKELINKSKLIELQLPKRYNFGLLNKHIDRSLDGKKVLDESQFLIESGYPVKIIKGSRANIKITFIEDKELLEK